MNNSAIVFLAAAWKTAPIKKEVPAIIIDLYMYNAVADQCVNVEVEAGIGKGQKVAQPVCLALTLFVPNAV